MQLDIKTRIALKALWKEGFRPEAKSPYHIKVGRWNFWPSSGKIKHDDRAKVEALSGVDSFIRTLHAANLTLSR